MDGRTAEGQPADRTQSLFEELLTPGPRKSLRRLPSVLGRAVRMAWATAGRDFRAVLALQLMAAALVGVRLLATREAAQAVDSGTLGGGAAGLIAPVLVLLVVTVVISCLASVEAERKRIFAEEMARYVQGRILDVTQSVQLISYDRPAFFDRVQRAQFGSGTRPVQMALGLAGIASGTLAAVGIVVALAAVKPLLVPLVVVAYLPVWFVTKRNSTAAGAFDIAYSERERRRGYLSEVLSEREYAKELRTFGVAHRIRSWYDAAYQDRLDRLRQLGRDRLRRSLVATALSGFMATVVLALALRDVQSGRLSFSTGIVCVVALIELGGRLSTVYAGAGAMYEGVIYLEDLDDFLSMEVAAPPQPPGLQIEPVPVAHDGSTLLVARDLRFTYPQSSAAAVDGVSLSLVRGQLTALVGANGCGKTTLAALLCGLYEPESGVVASQDTPVASADLRTLTTGVFQDFARYELTAFENIALGQPEAAAQEAVRAAAVAAGVDDLIVGLPIGYDTLLGRRFFGGSELSVGQWQRLALARAFMRDSPVLVLDEPTAALDPLAEAEVFASMRRLGDDKAVLIISHRFSSVRLADRILVMQEGRIVEEGDHASLMLLEGLYYQMFTTQAAAFGLA